MKRIIPGLLTAISFLVHFSCSEIKIEHSSIKNGIEINGENISLRVQFYDDDIVRVVKWLPESTPDKLSLSVIKKAPDDIGFELMEDKEHIILKSEKLIVKVTKRDMNITYFLPEGSTLLQESSIEFFNVIYKNDSAYQIKQEFLLSKDEGIYGLGQHQYGYMNYRGKTVKLVQTNTDAVNPFLISTCGYGILWDNYSKTIYSDDGNKNASLWSDVADNIDYYFVAGKNMDEIIAGYRELTGQAPMYGKWAFGYWQSKEHYDTRDELLGVAEKYRRLRIPIDNMIQDWDYWNGRENWSGMFFDPKLFPEPKEMIDRLHKMNFHVIISIWPALGPNTEIYKDMQKQGFLYPLVGWAGFKYYDAFNPAANALYWKYLKKGLYSKGLDGWWIDSTEPDVVNALTKESTEYEMKKVGNNYLGSWARYLNAFSLVMTDDIYKNWRKETSERRAYVLTRSCFAGQQRNAATTWSGDIGASWDVYKNQIVAGINHSMAGIPYWTFDIGAYVIGAYDGIFYKGGKDPAFQELYTRMFQLGTFTPIFRSHGSETPREIWEMGENAETLIKYDNLRYRLMPYIYSLAWKVTNEGYTIMRGLPMDFTEDRNTYDIGDQFMFGPSVMVCPVTEYMYFKPPEATVSVGADFFKTSEGKPGLQASYYKDNEYKVFGKEKIDPNIDLFWYTGRPEYVSDSMFSVRWQGKLIPPETGPYQFHLKSFDNKRIILDGDTLEMVYTSVEQYTGIIELTGEKEYDFVLETENSSTGAARMQLFWKTPEIFRKEQIKEKKKKIRHVYLPSNSGWIDFWTGKSFAGGKRVESDAPIDKIPLFIKAGSIIPMGPFVQYASEKPANPLELRIYPGDNGHFILYEDENDNYNYEKGIFATIDFFWNDTNKTLTITDRNGEFPGMLTERVIQIVVVKENHGKGIEICSDPDEVIIYNGEGQTVQL